MPRKPTLLNDTFPYHIYARTNNKEPFPIPLYRAWKFYLKALQLTNIEYELKVHAFVLMPNHFHLIASTPNSNLSCCMKYFMQKTTTDIIRASGRINRLYGGRYKWCLVSDENYYACLIKYVFLNPVRAQLVKNPEFYPYTTFNNDSGIISQQHLFNHTVPISYSDLIDWVTKPISNDFTSAVKSGLRRKEFRLPRKSNKCPDNGSRFL